MKKIIVTIASVLFSAVVLSAQDLAAITETFNNGAAALSNGEKTQALEFFQSALTGATALGDAGKDVVANCKSVIPNIFSSIAKDLFKEGNIDGAISKLQEGLKVAEEFANEEAKTEISTLIGQFLFKKGNDLFNAKDFAGAAAIYKQVLEGNPADGKAALRLGMALASIGDVAGAEEAYKTAAANGQEAAANKQFGNLALKAANAALKAKNYKEAVGKALVSIEYNPNNATAYKIAGTASNLAQNKADAVKYLSKYLELSPKAADAAQIQAAITALKK